MKRFFYVLWKAGLWEKEKKMENLLFEKENWKPYLIITYSHRLYCYLEREILLHILDDDDQER